MYLIVVFGAVTTHWITLTMFWTTVICPLDPMHKILCILTIQVSKYFSIISYDIYHCQHVWECNGTTNIPSPNRNVTAPNAFFIWNCHPGILAWSYDHTYVYLLTTKSYNKNQWVVYSCLEMQVNCFCVGIFYESEGRMKYPYTKTINLHLQARIHHELVLVFMPYYFCFDYINVYVQF